MSLKKSIGITGSTGSIGINSLNVIRNLINSGHYIDVVFLSSNSRIDVLTEQIEEFSPKYVFINDSSKAKLLKESNKINKTKVIELYEDFLNIISDESYDMLINALVGASGLLPTIKALESGKRVGLANKESLVIAGEYINRITKEKKSELIPIDSEHSAILQCIFGEKEDTINKIILTASGGPFRGKRIYDLKDITPENALSHPNWKMGNKITIDSATLMNKGLEVIEALWLFNLDLSKISVVIHPQSIIHSLVEFTDKSVKAQLGYPDMKLPIQYSITYPERIENSYEELDLLKIKNLTFEEPDLTTFECLSLAYIAAKEAGILPAVLNASNEIAVFLFLQNKIKFLEIPEIIKKAMDETKNFKLPEIQQLIETDKMVRNKILHEYNY